MADLTKFTKEPSFLATMIVNPKDALTTAGLDENNPDHKEDIKRLEFFAKMAHENLRAAGVVAKVEIPQLAWGIGASCCNGISLVRDI